MKSKHFTLSLVILFICSSFLNAQNKPSGSAFIGKSYKILIVSPETGKIIEDNISFSDKNFISENYIKQGFAATPFIEKLGGDAVYFYVTAASEKEGNLKWRGSVRGNITEGTIIWEKNGQAPIKYTFRGNLNKPSETK
jgi:hypothetical protein